MINPDEAPPGHVACAPEYKGKESSCTGCVFFNKEDNICTGIFDDTVRCSPHSRKDGEWVILKVKP